jgi:signal recognition particle subunit SEC65
MKNWREKIKKSDITEACRQAGFKSTQPYYKNYKLPKEDWSDSFIRIMTILKGIVCEREKQLQEL